MLVFHLSFVISNKFDYINSDEESLKGNVHVHVQFFSRLQNSVFCSYPGPPSCIYPSQP